MPGKSFTVIDKKSGKSYIMPWDKEKPPSSLEARQFIFEKSKGPGLWDKLNEPLTDLPSRAARSLGKNFEVNQSDIYSPFRAKVKGFAQGATEAAGDMASSMTSPLSLGLTALTFGSGGAAKAGLGGLSRGLTYANRAAGGATAAHGGYRAATADSLPEAGSGLLEMAMGGLGVATPHPDMSRLNTPINKWSNLTERAPGLVNEERSLAPTNPNRGWQFGRRSQRPIDAEYSVGDVNLPPDIPAIEGPPASNRRALPPARRTFYEGPRGLRGDLQDVGSEGLTPAESAQEALIPNRYRQARPPTVNPNQVENIGRGPLNVNRIDESLGDVGPVQPEGLPARSLDEINKSPYARTDDSDVEFLAKTGDKDAIAEAARRPSLRERLKALFTSEVGAVGDLKNDPLNPKNRLPISDTRQEELSQKFGGTKMKNEPRDSIIDRIKLQFKKLRDDQTGSVNITGMMGQGAAKTKPQSRSEGFHPMFEDWVNTRRASKIEGILKQKEFKDLDSLGQQGIFDFQEGARSGRLADVSRYFEDKFRELNKGGVRLGYRENYLPQLWDDPADKVFETYRRLGLKPSFALDRVLENYKAGIAEGLKPKFTTISDLMGWYEGRANKALADRAFFDHLVEKKQLAPKAQAPSHWVSLDPDHFPVQKFKSKGKEYQGVLAAPPEIANMVNNYLRVPESELSGMKPGAVLQWAADKASMTKNFVLSSGVPFTGINAHGANIFARTVIGNPKEALTAGKYIFHPKSARLYLDEAMKHAPDAVRNGLTLTTEGHEIGVVGSTNLAGKSVQGLLKAQGKMFEDPLFQNIIPALKLKHYLDMADDLVKTGLGRQAAGKQAAEFTNNLYGGINWEAMGKSRDLQNVARLLVLAPDWLRSNVNLGAGIAKTLVNPNTPQGKQYARLSRNLIGAYLAADVVNYAQNGHHMWENSPGHALDIQIGRSGEKDRYIRPFGTAADFARLPFEVAASAVKGDLGQGFRVIKNRASIPANTAGNLIFNQDDFGKPIYGKDDYGRKIPVGKQAAGIAGEVSGLVTPTYIKSGIDYMSGKSNAEQAVMGAAEMPLRYAQRPKASSSSRSRSRPSRSR